MKAKPHWHILENVNSWIWYILFLKIYEVKVDPGKEKQMEGKTLSLRLLYFLFQLSSWAQDTVILVCL